MGAESPTTISNDLCEALKRNATNAATALPETLNKAFKKFSNLISSAWLEETKTPISPQDLNELLRLCRVISLGEVDDRRIVEILSHVVAVPGDEIALWNVLTTWATKASANGTGGDLATLREYLALAGGVRLAAAPSFCADVKKLKAHSAIEFKRVGRFRMLRTPDGDVSINRLVTDAVLRAAAEGSFLITGEPGSGKSAVLHAAAEALAASAPVVFLSVDETAASLDALGRDIGLEHRITEILHAFDGNRPAFLFLDALDAVRGGPADAVYRKLIKEVSAMEEWHVIASVRSFDLRMGRELRSLLSGQPPEPQFAEKAFGTVRHIHVPVLSDTEIELIGMKSPSVALALKNGDAKLKDLARNPFNISLLSGLLTSGVQASELVLVTTRGQLLEHYWVERVDDLGLGTEIAISKIVHAMLDRRSTKLDITLIDLATANIVDDLARRGVLVREGTRHIAFRHHVFYDFAISRFALSPDEQAALELCSRAKGAGLLLAPSLGYWLDERFRNAAPADFWWLVISLTASNEIDPIIRVESARLAVELVAQPNDLEYFVDSMLADSDGTAVQTAIHLVGAILTRSAAGLGIARIPWANFVARLRPLPRRFLFATQSLLNILLEGSPTAEIRNMLGSASRELMDAVLADENLAYGLSAQAIKFVACTYATDPESSRHRLSSLFEPGRFSRIGYKEIPWLTYAIQDIAAADTAFAIEIYQRVFSAPDFDRSQKTSMGGGWIMSLTSNAGQDFDMARYQLAKDYKTILESDPRAGACILAVTLDGEIKRKHHSNEDKQVQSFIVGGKNYSLIDDSSCIWAWDIEDEHIDYAKIVKVFLKWILTASSAQQILAIEALLENSSIALAWRCAFVAGTSQPESIGLYLWPLVSRPEFLMALDTRHSAIELIAAIYPHLSIHERENYEVSIEGFDFSKHRHYANTQSEILVRLYAAIGKDHLVTNAARERLKVAIEQQQSLENKRPFEVTSSWGECEPHDWIRGNTASPPNSDVLDINDRVEKVLSAFKTSPTPDGLVDLVAGIEELDCLVESLRIEGLLSDVDSTASDTLARCIEVVLNIDEPSAKIRQDEFIKLLLRLSEHPDPETRLDTEANFAKSPGWGCPCPRIHAAEAIASIMGLPEIWPMVANTVERLALQDTHPAVRMMVINRLCGLWKERRDDMWRLVEEVSRQEQNAGVMQSIFGVLWSLRCVEAARVEGIFLPILDRITSRSRGEHLFANLLVYFAIARELPLSRTRLDNWVSNFEANEEHVRAVICQLRGLVVLGYEGIKESDVEIGRRTREFITNTFDKIEPAIRSWPMRGGEPTDEEQAAFHLLRAITDVFFFGTGARGTDDKQVIKTHAAQAAFLRDNAGLIRRISQLGTPYEVYHMLQMFEGMVPAEPALCFDLICDALLRPAGVARYEHELLGADLFVKLVSRYLADYRGLFTDDTRRRRLIDCIDVFVEAGWPEARRLFQSLPELLS